MAVEQGGLEIGRAERLGEAVHRIDVRAAGTARAAAAPPTVSSPPLLVSRRSERRRVGGPGRLDQLHPERRNAGQSADAVALARPDHVARRSDSRAARRAPPAPRSRAAGSGHNRSSSGSTASVTSSARQAEIMRDADRAEPHIGVAQHHALGPAGRAGGVEQGGELVGIGGRGAEQRRASSSMRRCASSRRVPSQAAGYRRAPASPAAPASPISRRRRCRRGYARPARASAAD